MTPEEKYTKLVTEKIPATYEAGKRDEHREFWEVFQQGGEPMSYNHAFSYNKFTDENYNPIYPINCSDGTLTSTQIFYNAYYITDTKVDIYASSKRLNQCFSGATGLVTIRGLHLYETTTLDTAFGQCDALENIKIYGTIGQTVSFQWSKKLTHDSLMSIINALKDYSGSGTTYIITLGADNIAKLTADEQKIATNKGWLIE